MRSHNFSIVKEAPAIRQLFAAWQALKERIVGKRYGVTVVWTGTARMRSLNHTYRARPQTTGVLAFPLTRDYGEVFLCASRITREAAAWERTPAQHASALFMHALLHLKGMDHVRTRDRERMEREEKRLFMWYNKKYLKKRNHFRC